LSYHCNEPAANGTSPVLPSSQNSVQDQKVLCSGRSFLADPWHSEPFMQLTVVAQLDLEISAGLSRITLPHTTPASCPQHAETPLAFLI